MAISTTTIKHVYNGKDAATVFPYTFPISTTDGSDILVYLTNAAGVITLLTTEYTVNVGAATVTYPNMGAPLATGMKLTITRVEILTQLLDLITQGSFNADIIEAALDKLTMITQQHAEELSRCPKYPVDKTPTLTGLVDFINTITVIKAAIDVAKTAALAAQAAAEVAQTAAELAETHAETAETNAETAETNAETAETNAELAETNAEAAQLAAENARDAAVIAQTAAELAETHAETAETNAELAETNAETAETNAELAETNAEAARDLAQTYAAALQGTSTSSVAIGTGAKTFTTQAGKQFAAGQFILIVDAASNANYMHGQVTSYTGTTLVVDVQSSGGSGTIANWKIYLSGARGAAGSAAVSGNFVNGDLAAGILTVTHGLGLSAPYTLIVKVVDNNSKEVDCPITFATNTFAIDLTDYATLSGTWGYRYL